MPLNLVKPRSGKSPNWTIRGAYLGIRINRTAGTPERAVAARALRKLKDEIERGAYADPAGPTFASAALGYLKSGGETRFMARLVEHFGEMPLRSVDQQAIDRAAVELYPASSAATRNRQVYTPVIAILARAGVETRFRRPQGSAGKVMVHWLWPEEFEALAAAADNVDAELGILFRLICYTGLRLSEALRLECGDVRVAEESAFVPHTKNGDPRLVYLPAVVVAALAGHPRGIDRAGRIFRWTRCGMLYLLAERAYAHAGVDHKGQPFHILRHTFATWMRRYGGADEKALMATGAWRDPKSAARYTHAVVSEDARRASLLPVGGKGVASGAKGK